MLGVVYSRPCPRLVLEMPRAENPGDQPEGERQVRSRDEALTTACGLGRFSCTWNRKPVPDVDQALHSIGPVEGRKSTAQETYEKDGGTSPRDGQIPLLVEFRIWLRPLCSLFHVSITLYN